MASKWWSAETWGTHTQQGTVTADRISELLVKLRQEHLLAEGRKGPMCRLQMEGSGLTVEMGNNNNNNLIKYPLDNIVFCHVDSALPDAIVWVVRQEDNELRACVFKCERPGAAICLYTTFNDLHRRNRMDNRKRYLISTVTSPKGTTTQESTLVAATISPTDSYGRIRAQVVAELQNKLSKNVVYGANARVAGVRKEVQDGGEGGNGTSDPKDLLAGHKVGRFQCATRPVPSDTTITTTTTAATTTLKGGYCCCWANQSKKCRCSSVGGAAFEKVHCIAEGGHENNATRKQSNGWPVSSVVKKLLNRKKNTLQGPGLRPEPEVTVRRVLPSGGYGFEAKRKQVAPTVPLFWSPPPVRTGAILLPVLPPSWVSAHTKPRPMVNQGTNGRIRLLRRRGSTGSDNVELSPVWATGTLLPVYQTGSEHPPRSVMKKKAPPIPVATVKKNVTFHAFATVQVMN